MTHGQYNGSEEARAAEQAGVELVERASAMIPVLRARAADCEEQGGVPPSTLVDFRAAGLLRAAQPTRFGGFGCQIDTVGEIAMQLGRGCGSSGWLASQSGAAAWILGSFDARAQEEVWADAQDASLSIACGLEQFDRRLTDEGIVITGSVSAVSGGADANWMIIGTPQAEYLVARADLSVGDQRAGFGLRGSGPINFAGVVVPEHRIVESDPTRCLCALAVAALDAALTVGAAQGVVDVFDEWVLEQAAPLTGERPAAQPANQLEFAEVCAEIDGARTTVRAVLKELRETRSSGAQVEFPAQIERDIAFANRLCARAVERLGALGPVATAEQIDASERLARDVRTAVRQCPVQWGEAALRSSRSRWTPEPAAG